MGRKPEKEGVRRLTLGELNEGRRKICSELLIKLFFIKELRSNSSFKHKHQKA